jgi:hypothetical protein
MPYAWRACSGVQEATQPTTRHEEWPPVALVAKIREVRKAGWYCDCRALKHPTPLA